MSDEFILMNENSHFYSQLCDSFPEGVPSFSFSQWPQEQLGLRTVSEWTNHSSIYLQRFYTPCCRLVITPKSAFQALPNHLGRISCCHQDSNIISTSCKDSPRASSPQKWSASDNNEQWDPMNSQSCQFWCWEKLVSHIWHPTVCGMKLLNIFSLSKITILSNFPEMVATLEFLNWIHLQTNIVVVIVDLSNFKKKQ